MDRIINKTMDRFDLFAEEAMQVTESINNLINVLYAKKLYMTSWYGNLPVGMIRQGVEDIMRLLLMKPRNKKGVGLDNRGFDYEPLPEAADDSRLPWYLYWEIFWVIKNGPQLNSSMRLLDAGGTSSLFTCYLSSLGCQVHSIDLNGALVINGDRIAKAMGWEMFSYMMNMEKLDFEDEYFDHAYAICVFEHLDFELKQRALNEIARCLKPGGILSITFDYRNPAPGVVGYGPDQRSRNQISNQEDIKSNFLSTGCFELLGNKDFYDNNKSYLVHPAFGNMPYTFGAIFLRKNK